MVETGAGSQESAGTIASTPTRRKHSIVLCCAESVRPMVDEVAHSLGGLGFRTEVVCGKEARAILLGRDRHVTVPTIYVVCVQGALKEQVLEPLRQALLTHGGPNQHLFAAVLDVTLPLSMVGQVRRFSEALERLPAAAGAGGRERRQWREHYGKSPIERSTARPIVVPGAARPVTASQRIIVGRPARGQTTKAPTILRPPSRERPAAPAADSPATATAIEATTPLETTPAPIETASAPIATTPVETKAATIEPPARDPVVAERRRRARPLPEPIVQTPLVLEPAPRHGRSIAIAALAVAAAAVVWIALPSSATEPSPTRTRSPEPAAVTRPAPANGPPARADHAARGVTTPAVAAAPAEPLDPPPSSAAPERDSSSAASARPLDERAGLEAAAASHRIRRGPSLWVSRPQGETSTWSVARERCAEYEVEGVGGWRLPFRRELQMLQVAGLVTEGAWWSRTLVEDDKDAAYVLDAGSGQLVVWLRAEPNAGTLCVRARD